MFLLSPPHSIMSTVKAAGIRTPKGDTKSKKKVTIPKAKPAPKPPKAVPKAPKEQKNAKRKKKADDDTTEKSKEQEAEAPVSAAEPSEAAVATSETSAPETKSAPKKRQKRQPGTAEEPRTSERTVQAKRHAKKKNFKRSGPSKSASILFVSDAKLRVSLNRYGIVTVRREVYPIMRDYVEEHMPKIANIIDAMLPDGKRVTADSMVYAIENVEKSQFHRHFISLPQEEKPRSGAYQSKKRKKPSSVSTSEKKSKKQKEVTEELDSKHVPQPTLEPGTASQTASEEGEEKEAKEAKDEKDEKDAIDETQTASQPSRSVSPERLPVVPPPTSNPRAVPRLRKPPATLFKKTVTLRVEETSQEPEPQNSVAVEDLYPSNQLALADMD